MFATACTTLKMLLLTSTIYFTDGCGQMPRNARELRIYYRERTTNCAGFHQERVYSENKLLVDCEGGVANISMQGVREGAATLVALCRLQNGTCLEDDIYMLYRQKSIQISLPQNSTYCFFASCFTNPLEYTYYFYYTDLSECAVTPTLATGITATTPTTYFHAQETTEAAEYTTEALNNHSAQDPTGWTSGPTTQVPPHNLFSTFIFAVVVTISATAIVTLILVIIMALRFKTRDLLKIKSNMTCQSVHLQPEISIKDAGPQQNTHTFFCNLSGTDRGVAQGVVTLSEKSYNQLTKLSTIPTAKVESEHANVFAQGGVEKSIDIISVSNSHSQEVMNNIHSNSLDGLTDQNVGNQDQSFNDANTGDSNEVISPGCTTSVSLNIDQHEGKEDQGYILHEQNADNLSPASLTRLSVDIAEQDS